MAPAAIGDRTQRVQVPWRAALAACWVQPVAEDGRLGAADPTTTRPVTRTRRSRVSTTTRRPSAKTGAGLDGLGRSGRGIGWWDGAQEWCPTDVGPYGAGETASDLHAAVPKQREQESDANRQRAETEHEQRNAAEGRKRPEARPCDDAKQRRRS